MQAPTPSLAPLNASLVSVVQWTLVGIEVLVLAYVLVWAMRHTRLGRMARPWRRLQPAQGEGSVEVGGARGARLVSMGGGAAEALRGEPATGPRRPPRAARAGRTPPRPAPAVTPLGTPAAPERPVAPRALHCPACGTLLARGEPATRLVTRCTGCDRRVAVRTDGERVVVTVEG